jgi:hypothetical protein
MFKQNLKLTLQNCGRLGNGEERREPDVVGYDKETSEYIFYDCSPQTPKGRINICYDGEGQKERAKHGGHPAGNAVDMAATMASNY